MHTVEYRTSQRNDLKHNHTVAVTGDYLLSYHDCNYASINNLHFSVLQNVVC